MIDDSRERCLHFSILNRIVCSMGPCAWLWLPTALLLVVVGGAKPPLYTRPPPASDLDLNHMRLRRLTEAQQPEQIHLALAGAGAVAISWVTWPQEDIAYKHLFSDSQLQALGSDHCSQLRQLPLRTVVRFGTDAASTNHWLQAKGTFTCYHSEEYRSGALHTVVLGLGDEGPLEANTTYFYQAGDISDGETFKFTTPPPPGSFPYRLGVIGDLGQTDNSIDTLDHMAAQQPQSILNVGDLSYADGYQPRWDSFGRLIEPSAARVPWQVIEGNHEEEVLAGKNGFVAYETRYYVPAAFSQSGSALYYSYEVAGIHAIMLGCYTDFDAESEQYAWLERDLAAVDRSRTPWLIVGMHAPWYNSNESHNGEMEAMRKAMEDLLFQHGVDIVFAGHVHAYERMYRVYRGSRHSCGSMYINIGDGGNREGLAHDYQHPQPSWSALREPSYGAGVLSFHNSTHATWEWHRNQDNMFEVGDSVQLIRNTTCKSPFPFANLSGQQAGPVQVA